jgi:hypothetical protein
MSKSLVLPQKKMSPIPPLHLCATPAMRIVLYPQQILPTDIHVTKPGPHVPVPETCANHHVTPRGVGHATYLTVTSDPHDIVSKVRSSECAPVPSHTLTTGPHIIGETFESPQRPRDDPPDAHAIGGHQPGPHRAPHAAYNGEEVHPLC